MKFEIGKAKIEMAIETLNPFQMLFYFAFCFFILQTNGRNPLQRVFIWASMHKLALRITIKFFAPPLHFGNMLEPSV
jgi:hypothetical protein